MEVKKKCRLFHKWSDWNYSPDTQYKWRYCKKCGKVQREMWDGEVFNNL